MDKFLNKEVRIYPSDTNWKFGIVREVTENGVVFEITKSECPGFKVGSLQFISYSAKLDFSLAQ